MFVCYVIDCFGLYDDGFSEQRRLQCLLFCDPFTARTMEDLCTRCTCFYLHFLQDCFLLFHNLLCYFHGNSRFSRSSGTLQNRDLYAQSCWCCIFIIVVLLQVMAQTYRMCNVWGEPLSQTAQSFMPEMLYGANRNLPKARTLLKSLMIIGATLGLVLGVIGTAVPGLFPGVYTHDKVIISEVCFCFSNQHLFPVFLILTWSNLILDMFARCIDCLYLSSWRCLHCP